MRHATCGGGAGRVATGGGNRGVVGQVGGQRGGGGNKKGRKGGIAGKAPGGGVCTGGPPQGEACSHQRANVAAVRRGGGCRVAVGPHGGDVLRRPAAWGGRPPRRGRGQQGGGPGVGGRRGGPAQRVLHLPDLALRLEALGRERGGVPDTQNGLGGGDRRRWQSRSGRPEPLPAPQRS